MSHWGHLTLTTGVSGLASMRSGHGIVGQLRGRPWPCCVVVVVVVVFIVVVGVAVVKWNGLASMRSGVDSVTAARSTLAFPVWDPGGFTGRFRAPRKHIPVHRSLLNHHHDPNPLNVTYLKAERRKWSLRKHIPPYFDRLESSKIQSFNQTSTKTRGLVPENLCGFIKWNYFRRLLPYDDSKTQCQDEFRNLSGCVLKILTASRMLQISIARCQIEPEIHSFPTMYGKGGSMWSKLVKFIDPI